MNGTIECRADANPPVTLINWTKNGQPQTGASGPTVELVNAAEKDAGLYTCQARNSIGSSLPFEMHVIVAGMGLHFSSHQIKNFSTSVVLACPTRKAVCESWGECRSRMQWVRRPSARAILASQHRKTWIKKIEHPLEKNHVIEAIDSERIAFRSRLIQMRAGQSSWDGHERVKPVC